MFCASGALFNFYVHKRAAGRSHANASNYKENFGIPHFVLASAIAPTGKRKCGRLPKFCAVIVQWYLQDDACANFAKEKYKSARGKMQNMSKQVNSLCHKSPVKHRFNRKPRLAIATTAEYFSRSPTLTVSAESKSMSEMPYDTSEATKQDDNRVQDQMVHLQRRATNNIQTVIQSITV